VRQLEEVYKQTPEIRTYLSINYSAPHSYHVLILKPSKERKRSSEEIVAFLNEQTKGLSGVTANVFLPPPPLVEFAGNDSGDRLGLVMMTASDFHKLHDSTVRLMNEIKKIPGVVHADNQLKWDNQQFQIDIDRDRAADLNISIPSITNTISMLMVGRQVGKTDDAKVFVKINKVGSANPNVFQQLYVRSNDNKIIPLASVLTVRETTAPEVYHHFNRLRSDAIYLSLAPDIKLADAIGTLQKTAKATLPEDMRYEFTGEAKKFMDSSGKTATTFILALIFIYLVLVAQFESFIDPLIIMLTVPFAVVGAMITLKLFGGSLNIYSNIGLITLIGLIAKHGILITEFANRLRSEGKLIQEAIVEAAIMRLRPILMTTAAMVLGAVPLAFAFGPGSESRQQIGLVITGGMLFGTLFSLVIVPIMYTYLAPFRKIEPSNQEIEHATAL
jgi:multidrug efflux pump